MGLLILGRSGRILAANRAGRHALDHSGVIKQSNGVVTLSSPAQHQALHEMIRRTKAGDRTPAALRVSRRPRKPFLLLFLPVWKEKHRPSDPLAVLILNGSLFAPNNHLLIDFFGFTPAEATVAAHLMQGMTVGDVAEALGTSENTTRNHLKRMYAKTDTRRQSELVHTLLSSPAALLLSQTLEETH